MNANTDFAIVRWDCIKRDIKTTEAADAIRVRISECKFPGCGGHHRGSSIKSTLIIRVDIHNRAPAGSAPIKLIWNERIDIKRIRRGGKWSWNREAIRHSGV